jgi:glycerol-3-phosphate dehydrogenase
MEPDLQGIAALYSPETAITSPYLYTIALAENAIKNGVQFFLDSQIRKIEKIKAGQFLLKTQNDQFEANYIINSAGVYSDQMARLAGINYYHIYPCRGEYYVLDKNAASLINHLIYPVPHPERVGWVFTLPPLSMEIFLLDLAMSILKNEMIMRNKAYSQSVMSGSSTIFTYSISEIFYYQLCRIRAKQTSPSQGGYQDFVMKRALLFLKRLTLLALNPQD